MPKPDCASEAQRAKEAGEAQAQLADAERQRAAAEQRAAQAFGDADAIASLGLEQSGAFLNCDGTPYPW